MTLELLVTQSIPTTRKVRATYSTAIGRLVTPRHYPSLAETVAEGITLAADNDGFGGVDFAAFDAYKLGVDVALIVAEARRRGLWVHVGRVNTVRRLRHAEALGANSVDGSGWARFRDAMLPRYARWIEAGRPTDLNDLTDPFAATGFAALEEGAAA
jgi:hypothetical protein